MIGKSASYSTLILCPLILSVAIRCIAFVEIKIQTHFLKHQIDE
jgi:hypothetical protein